MQEDTLLSWNRLCLITKSGLLFVILKRLNTKRCRLRWTHGASVYGMWANYFDSEIAPTDPSTPTTPPSSITAKISASTSAIKVGGSYKNLTVNLFNDSNEDITTEYADATFTWTCSIDNEDWTDKVTWRVGTEYNQKKVKFPSDTSVIGKILSIKCKIVKDNLQIESEILSLELTE